MLDPPSGTRPAQIPSSPTLCASTASSYERSCAMSVTLSRWIPASGRPMRFTRHTAITQRCPHLAIVPSILHYTEPGDTVLDGFAGSGMTGVAAQWCGSAPSAYRKQLEAECSKQGLPKPKWGARRVVLNDLGPAASFIAANYTLPFDVAAFLNAAQRIISEVQKELGWMVRNSAHGRKVKRIYQFHSVERGVQLPGVRR